MTVLRIVLTPVLFGEAPAFGGIHSSSGRVAACGDQCLGQKAALNVTEPFAVTRIAPGRPAIAPDTIWRINIWRDQTPLAVLGNQIRPHRFSPSLGNGVANGRERMQRLVPAGGRWRWREPCGGSPCRCRHTPRNGCSPPQTPRPPTTQ